MFTNALYCSLSYQCECFLYGNIPLCWKHSIPYFMECFLPLCFPFQNLIFECFEYFGLEWSCFIGKKFKWRNIDCIKFNQLLIIIFLSFSSSNNYCLTQLIGETILYNFALVFDVFLRLTCSMIYYGISLSSGGIGDNIYLVFFLTSVVAIPSNFLATYLVDKYGRKKILVLSLVIGALSLITAASFPFKNSGIFKLLILFVKEPIVFVVTSYCVQFYKSVWQLLFWVLLVFNLRNHRRSVSNTKLTVTLTSQQKKH